MNAETPHWLADLIDAGRALEDGAPDRARAEAVRTSVLLAAADCQQARLPRPRRPLLWLAAALALGCSTWFFVLSDEDSNRTDSARREQISAALAEARDLGRRASIETSQAADFEHTRAVADDNRSHDEVVRLRAGRVKVAVAKLRPRERFRVIASHAEVEVRGASFAVEVHRDQLTAVVVHSGLVEVRIEGRPTMVLAAGARWSATDRNDTRSATWEKTASDPDQSPAHTADATPREPPQAVANAVSADGPAPERARRPTPQRTRRSAPQAPPATAVIPTPSEPSISARAPAGPPTESARRSKTEASEAPLAEHPAGQQTPPPPAATVTERAFEAGWQSMRDGDYGRAADAFARAIRAAPDAPLAEDARYWRAVALARASRTDAARVAMARFLKRHPQSSRAGEISVMLGWLELDAGDLGAAKARFRAGLSARDAKVRDAAEQGLLAVERAANGSVPGSTPDPSSDPTGHQ